MNPKLLLGLALVLGGGLFGCARLKPRIIVRIAATVSASFALAVLAILAFSVSRLFFQGADSPRFFKTLGAFGLLAIVPLIFVWAAIQAWRGIPQGIVTLSSGWMLLGLGGSIFHLFWFFTEWIIKDALGAIIWTCMFLFGVLIAGQEKKIANKTIQH